MCYKKHECPHYQCNAASGNYNACGSCEYIVQMRKLQRNCKIGLAIAALIFLGTTYLLF